MASLHFLWFIKIIVKTFLCYLAYMFYFISLNHNLVCSNFWLVMSTYVLYTQGLFVKGKIKGFLFLLTFSMTSAVYHLATSSSLSHNQNRCQKHLLKRYSKWQKSQTNCSADHTPEQYFKSLKGVFELVPGNYSLYASPVRTPIGKPQPPIAVHLSLKVMFIWTCPSKKSFVSSILQNIILPFHVIYLLHLLPWELQMAEVSSKPLCDCCQPLTLCSYETSVVLWIDASSWSWIFQMPGTDWYRCKSISIL